MDHDLTIVAEFVQYDPENPDTFPSVCHAPEEVKDRFGFEGGEWLVFTVEGTYIGKLERMIHPPNEMIEV